MANNKGIKSLWGYPLIDSKARNAIDDTRSNLENDYQKKNDDTLTTTNKSISGAINEVKNDIIGDKGTLTTTNKTNIVESINEVNAQYKDIVKQVGVETLNTTAKDLKGAINEVFQSVSNGKTLVAKAITDKGMNTLATDTFQTMATNISKINSGSVEGLIVTIDGIKYKLSKNTEGNIIATKVKYTITNNLTNATNSNSVSEIEDSSSYSATISATTGYKVKTIVVSMNGVDITSTTVSGNTITINKVVGNIVVTVTTELDGNDIVGNVDSNNNINLTGLNAGTYTLKYEDDNGVISNYDTITTMEVN